jgi:predicted RNA-binding Zn ribbon-like protein
LSQAWSLRAALRDLALAAIEKRAAPSIAIETVNAVLQTNPTYRRISLTPHGLSESVSAKDMDYAWLVTIATDAVDLLCHSDLSLLRQCEHPTCVRVFYDTTKNHKRRWCVEKCGTHSKAAAYYRRKVAKNRLETVLGETKKL